MNKISLLFVTFIGLVSVGLPKNSTNFDERNAKSRKQISFDDEKMKMIKPSALEFKYKKTVRNFTFYFLTVFLLSLYKFSTFDFRLSF